MFDLKKIAQKPEPKSLNQKEATMSKEYIQNMQEAGLENSSQEYLAGTDQPPSIEAEPTHFDALIGTQEEIEELHDIAPDNCLSEEDFIEFYSGGFSFASGITGIKSLAMEQEDPNVKNGLSALYRISGRYRWLSWMKKPGGETMMDFLAVGTLFGGMAVSCAAEMQARKASRQPQAQAKSEAATPKNDINAMKPLREMAAEQGHV